MTTGYCSLTYADTYRSQGEILELGSSRAVMLKRPIADTAFFDVCSIYPFLTCIDPYYLMSDVFDVFKKHRPVSALIITDPLVGGVSEDRIPLQPYKQHHVCTLNKYSIKDLPENHRRNIRKAQKSLQVMIEHPPQVDNTWLHIYADIYKNLIQRHNIKPTANTFYQKEHFRTLMGAPGAVLFKCLDGEYVVNTSLFYITGKNAYYHLSCQSENGYKLQSNFLMMHTAIEYFASLGLDRLEIGATADGASTDGLARFKAGFGDDVLWNYIGRSILRADIYEQLGGTGEFFPAYRG